MRAYAINGQTATNNGFSGILYRATALIAGFDSGTFLTESAASQGGFRIERPEDPDFLARWTGSGNNVVHPNFHVSRLVPVVTIKRETARVVRWANLDGEAVTNAHRERVAKLAKGRHAEAKAFCKAFPVAGPVLLCFVDDASAVRAAVDMLATPDGSPLRRAWRDAMQAAGPKGLNFLTI